MADKFTEMQEVFERETFDDSAAILISVEHGKLEVTPFGGTFLKEGGFHGEETYELVKFLLDQASTFNGNMQQKELT